MPAEPLHIFDPRRNLQLQGFAGRAATTTIHNATETGISISGIFQAAEDFAVLGWWNAYDYYNHLRLVCLFLVIPLSIGDLGGCGLHHLIRVVANHLGAESIEAVVRAVQGEHQACRLWLLAK